MIHQTANGTTLLDGFYWVANLQKSYISMVYIQNKENVVRIFDATARMTIQNLLNLEQMNGIEILEPVNIPKKVSNYKFPDKLK